MLSNLAIAALAAVGAVNAGPLHRRQDTSAVASAASSVASEATSAVSSAISSAASGASSAVSEASSSVASATDAASSTVASKFLLPTPSPCAIQAPSFLFHPLYHGNCFPIDILHRSGSAIWQGGAKASCENGTRTQHSCYTLNIIC